MSRAIDGTKRKNRRNKILKLAKGFRGDRKSNYKPAKATCSSLIIALVTFVICMAGLSIGKKAGEKLEKKSNILGGTILIFIGIEIFLDGIF